MVQIKPLLSSLKERKRYILYKIKGAERIEKEFIYNMIKKFLGELGTGKAGVMMLSNKENKGAYRLCYPWLEGVWYFWISPTINKSNRKNGFKMDEKW